MDALPTTTTAAVLDRDGLQALIEALAARGFQVLGPLVRDEAIVHDEIAGVADLPAGWTDRQGPGQYRLERRDDQALFGFAAAPQSWKRFLHPPVETLWRVRQGEGGLLFSTAAEATPRYAFLGVRACDLKAIAIQDRVLCAGDYRDTGYERRRRDVFIVALNCSEAGDTCFCVSMGSGPKAEGAFDLALTELLDERRHEFLVEVGSAAGAEVLAGLPQRPALESDRTAAAAVVARTAGRMGRQLDTTDLQGLLQSNPEHPRWDEVAERCLSCANCTMVCPTCFCTTVEDHSDLAGGSAERVRLWDSCFTLDFSYIHGGSVRQTDKGRYRQWMTHKLSTWFDQFGSSGCVGCGRCITWCPVGIDITEEAAAIRATPHVQGGSHGES
ncbi:4Fe-4S dicluster domain-containing protein [Azotobacter chroococcum]|uniref:Soluble hydrogenase, alpha or beta chain n=1 Tax=Azotobacter chroococcum NCIMB 8003 TaxID=1328314 RepID=A0A0C4WJ82_9GAMM|nr:4Fe-4S dicluster domain-containing protein [Azotobacter chroococcum]AJE19939.1 Soluble hydrogenase, alpha or beta chain [Azotobacter chroococcum NCIMB 8003]